MRNIYTHILQKAILIGCLFLACTIWMHAQTYAHADTRKVAESRQAQSLKEILRHLSDAKGVSFLYEPEIVADVTILQAVDYQQSVTTVLNQILPQANLYFKKINEYNFVIKKDKKAARQISQKVNSTKISHFEPITQIVPDQLVTGMVRDFSSGEPLVGVTIVVKGRESVGTTTDVDGSYSINVPDGFNALIFSFVGFESKEVNIAGKSEVDVWMNEAINQLNEVVVTAVGIEANKRNLGYSIEEIDRKEIENANEANIISSLSGKAAGVLVTSASGAPGASANIRIRGNKSINGSNKPLFIVDGVPIDNSSAGNAAAGVDVSNRAIDINPNDIANISILKGPAATALYGIRAANGAVVITTKKGKEGKPRVTIKSSVGFNEVNQLPATQNIYAQGSIVGGKFTYRGPETGENSSYGPPMSELEFDGDPAYPYDMHGRLVPRGQGNGQPAIVYDPFETFFVTGNTFDNNVSVSGGNGRINYYISAGNWYESGVVPNSDWTRTSIKGNFDLQLFDKFNLGLNTTLVRSGGNRQNRGNSLSGVGIGLYRNPISFDIGNGKSGQEAADFPGAYIFPNGEQRAYRGSRSYDNPFWVVNRAPFKDDVNRIIQSVNLKYQLTDWMSFVYKLGVDHYSDKRNAAWDINSGSETTGRVDFSTRLSTDLNSDLLLLIDKDFGEEWGINGTFGYNFFSSDLTNRSTTGLGMTKQGFFHISNTATVQTNEGIFKRQLAGVFGDIRLSWRNILHLNLTGRNDWSSTLPNENNSFFYPTASLGLEFTELLGLTDSKFLSYGKLRASYGEVGNDAGLYLTANYFQQANADGDNLLPANSFPAFGINAFERAGTLGNNDLRAEKTATFEIGADLKLFLGRMSLDFTYYKATTTDLIVEANISAASGFIIAPVNAGKIENEGIELMLGVTPIRTNNFRWDINANFTQFENIVTELPDGIDQLSLAQFSALSSLIIEGQPYGVLVGTAYQRNAQGNLIIGSNGWPLINATQIKVGDPNPDWIAGLRNTFSYKGFTLSGLLDVRQGGDIWNGTKGVMNNLGVGEESGRDRNVTGFVFEGVTESGEPNTTPVDFANPANGMGGIKWRRGGFLGVAEDNVEDGSWIRLRELTLSYNFPSRWFQKTFLNGATLTFSGRNLWLSTDYSGVDPETNLRGDTNDTGWDYFNLPNTKGYTFTLNLNL